MDFKTYLASSSDEENEEDPEHIRNKYSSLLTLFQPNEEENEEMEITFTPGNFFYNYYKLIIYL